MRTTPATLMLSVLLLSSCGDEPRPGAAPGRTAPAQTSASASPSPACTLPPERAPGGDILDQEFQDPAIKARTDEGETTVGRPLTIDLLANDAGPEGKALVIKQIERPDLGSIEVCEGKLRYTPPPAGGLAGSVQLMYCLEGGNNFDACSSVRVDVLSEEMAELYAKARATGTQVPGVNLVGSDAREGLRKAGHGDAEIARLNAVFDLTSAQLLAQSIDNYPARLLVANACGGVSGILGEQYAILGENLAIALSGIEQATAEIEAREGTPPTLEPQRAAEEVQKVANSLELYATVEEATGISADPEILALPPGERAAAKTAALQEFVKGQLTGTVTGAAQEKVCARLKEELVARAGPTG